MGWLFRRALPAKAGQATQTGRRIPFPHQSLPTNFPIQRKLTPKNP